MDTQLENNELTIAHLKKERTEVSKMLRQKIMAEKVNIVDKVEDKKDTQGPRGPWEGTRVRFDVPPRQSTQGPRGPWEGTRVRFDGQVRNKFPIRCWYCDGVGYVMSECLQREINTNNRRESKGKTHGRSGKCDQEGAREGEARLRENREPLEAQGSESRGEAY